MRRGVGILLGVLALACGVSATPALAASPTLGRGLAPIRIGGAKPLGALAPRRTRITVVLAARHRGALDRLVSSPHRPLGQRRFMRRFGPRQATVRRVERWARANRLTVRWVSPNRSLIRIVGRSTHVGAALGVDFESFRAPSGRRFFATDRAATLPSSFAGEVASVLGLSSLGRVAVPHPVTAGRAPASAVRQSVRRQAGLPSLNFPASYGPQDLWSLYDAPAAQTGAGQELAIITEGDVSQPKADLATFEQRFGLRARADGGGRRARPRHLRRRSPQLLRQEARRVRRGGRRRLAADARVHRATDRGAAIA